MASGDSSDDFTFQKGLEELGEEIERADGIVPLKAGELRPPGYYMVNHYWERGRKPLPPSKRCTKR